MSRTISAAQFEGNRPQTFWTILRAETLKLWAPGGVSVWIVVAGVLGILSGVAAAFLSTVADLKAATPITYADVLTSGPIVLSFVLSLATCNYVPREIASGMVITSKYLVPRTGLLFAARVCSWVLVSLLLGVATTFTGVVSAFASPSLRFESGTLVQVAVALMLASLLVALAHAGAAWLQRGAVIVAVGMTLLFVLPLALGVGATLVPGVGGEALMALSRASLGAVLLSALQVPLEGGGSLSSWGISVLGFATWLTVTLLLAFRAFRRPGYGDT